MDRVLITHVGSLPRNPLLRDLLVAWDRGVALHREAL